MSKLASKVVEQAKAWIGRKESDGSHKEIIDVYNSHTPRARGYKVSYTDPWCATFVSAVAVKLGYTDIMPTECSCNKMIELYKKLGVWVEDENRTPNPGDILFYDWEDNGKGDNKGNSDHVGIVEKVSGGNITIIEGNYSNSVKRRTLKVNGKYIRGYAVPKYDSEAKPTAEFTIGMRNLKRGCTGEDVRALQILLNGRGCNGNMYSPDGKFGPNTEGAVKLFQKQEKLSVDGIAGVKTLGRLLGIS
jgi:hypothetical protein